jgi:4-diphosphocytidyl-2-C-methyl-D-erythritol kinase
MTRTIRLMAPAKVNWTLEVLRARPDGYHELRSVIQTISLCDVVTLTEADDLTLELRGEADILEDNPIESNLAYRAAIALRERTGARSGAAIVLEKHIPVAAGLGGGSSDAAAVIRGLDMLWNTRQPVVNLIEIAGEVGSDPPFFVVAGTAAIAGRGDAVVPLADALAPSIMLAIPSEGARGEKTAQMFSAITPDHYSDGDATLGVRETVAAGRILHDELLMNVFERVTPRMQPEAARAMDALRSDGYQPHLCGAGPSFFLLYGGGADHADLLARRIHETGFEARRTHALRRDEALRIEEH